jgi:hypothetical protein
MNRVLKYFAAPAAALLLSGCAGSLSTPVPGGKVQYDKKAEHAYIVFARPEFVGAALSNTIVEFDPASYTTKLVGTLGPQTKIVYETTPGTHYFYLDGGENDDMIKITAKKATEYYVHTAVSMGVVVGRFYFKPLRYQSLALAESLKGGACTTDVLNKYKFKEVKDATSDITGEKKYHSKQYNINIECRKGVIKRANYHGESLESMKGATLVQPNAEALKYYNEHRAAYVKEIKKDFAAWKREEMSKTALKPEDGKSMN